MSKLRVVVAMVVVLVGSLFAGVASYSFPGNGNQTLHVLMTNDDGVTAPGIAALADALQSLPNVRVRVVAPATNQSGTGDQFSTTPVTASPATTASGDAATAVRGFPADTVLYDVLAAHDRPDVVVSGANFGQNLGNVATVSGTVGAARTANRLGIPAIAVSAGFGAQIDYAIAARAASALVSAFRQDYEHHNGPAQTLNINVPSCATGAVRGIRLEPLGQSTSVSGYTPQSGTVDNGTFAPVVTNENPFAAADCTSTVTDVRDDIQAFTNGFIAVTVINPDLTDPFAFRPPTSAVFDQLDRAFARATGNGRGHH